MTPGSKPRSTTPNLGSAAVAGPVISSKAGGHPAAGQYPPYALGGARGPPEHMYNNVAAAAASAYGRPPMMGYDAHPHTRTPAMSANGMAGIPGGKP